MKYLKSIIIMAMLACGTLLYSQNTNDFKAINEQVWFKFYDAFKHLDHSLMKEIHSESLIRIAGGRSIRDFNEYMEDNKKSFERSKKSERNIEISLRFFERISNGKIASERGVYQVIYNKGTETESASYGQFHVLLEKVDDQWKIIMDYDSNENESINEASYNEAYAMDDLTRFAKN